jgi:CRISPR type III-B/RAMP module RAMP protein Cmr1
MMKTFKVECKVITPLFMGGANQQAELRTQSINGLLRWWFRIAGGSIEDEKRLFGWAGETSNQGLVRVKIEREEFNATEQIEENQKIADEILRLLEKRKDELERKIGTAKEYQKDKLLKRKMYIENQIEEVKKILEKLKSAKNNSQEFSEDLLKEIQKLIFLLEGYRYLGFSLEMNDRDFKLVGLTFDLKISFHPKANEEDIKKFFCALWLAFNLGNFGSRSRRGFGSIRIKEIKIKKIKEDGKEDYENITNNCYGLNFAPSGDLGTWINKNLNEIKKVLNQPRKDIPNLFDNFEIYIFGSNNDWQNLLNQAGQKYQSFRKQKPIDERIVFGLPIVAVGKYKDLRRASPLMFKILVDKDKYFLILIVMKPNEKRKFIFHPQERDHPIKNKLNWDLLSDFVKNKTKIFP